ncbi:helix-turn-helix domain-containing protein [Rhizosaccharibacter radicis]|uniref:Helix-turn-helix domain-containing protein n=1 Tax=Rhizosaccharibacter radicis TaxID=2782605 RepID=A0ABT1W209_9PROT|nr:helix-turn-helix domain-containing protein [Acetobacteraceae bacterium KSS12]
MARQASAKKSEFSLGEQEAGTERESRPSPIDVHVGSRIRLRRTLLGMSQERLGDALGLTFQQVQKYERGANRVGASRLFDLSRVLDVPVSFFFDDLPNGQGGHHGSDQHGFHAVSGFAEAQEGFGHAAGGEDIFGRKETVDLVRAYYRITEQPVRRRVLDLIKTMASSAAG